jgi:hypothetical protein
MERFEIGSLEVKRKSKQCQSIIDASDLRHRHRYRDRIDKTQCPAVSISIAIPIGILIVAIPG